jgi:hypothetical protein
MTGAGRCAGVGLGNARAMFLDWAQPDVAGLCAASGSRMLLNVPVIAAEVFPHLAPVSLVAGLPPLWRQRDHPLHGYNPAQLRGDRTTGWWLQRGAGSACVSRAKSP